MRFWLAPLVLLAALVNAKRRLDNAGDSIPTATTQPLQTIGAAPAYQTLLPRQEGDPNVGVPPDTSTNGPAPPTTYFQTSFDANGHPVDTATFVFTPSFAPSSARSNYPSGTVYNYDSWTAQFATATFVPNNAADRGKTLSILAATSSLIIGTLLLTM
ncbi:hypothetical protein M408DRAFT_330650 [Serendipita vermifera MAFF 305830]|uniref:Glycoside hydrolase family 16 protein n=1 Tax=Serendipita vermifera MAFF 305830 TaxID=933852 RepID=A0A0C2WIQ6_SERVB|nr:hypothetical protein M408DRAFT_330650 [Serendipita vermifera MAFF 305830]